jgi:hypothetical protein
MAADSATPPNLSVNVKNPATASFDGRTPHGCVSLPYTVTVSGDDAGQVSGYTASVVLSSPNTPAKAIDADAISWSPSDGTQKGTLSYCGGKTAGLQIVATVSATYGSESATYASTPSYLSVQAAPKPALSAAASTKTPKSGTTFKMAACADATGVPLRMQLSDGQSSSKVYKLKTSSKANCMTLTMKYTLPAKSKKVTLKLHAWTDATRTYQASTTTLTMTVKR